MAFTDINEDVAVQKTFGAGSWTVGDLVVVNQGAGRKLWKIRTLDLAKGRPWNTRERAAVFHNVELAVPAVLRRSRNSPCRQRNRQTHRDRCRAAGNFFE